MINLLHGDCLEVMRSMADNSVDSIVTDPPYGLAFMGKKWDHNVPSVEIWAEAFRVLKPGGHLLSFGGSRTYHRLTCAIEDAGFEIRDQIMWLYGSGFPKSHNLTGDWQGWGTALKPAHEPICVARKPLVGTVAANVLEHGTGALNIDGCRVGDEVLPAMTAGQAKIGTFERGLMVTPERVGRWPANVIHDGSDEVVERLGEPSRFFYCAKASKKDRDEGLEGFAVKQTVGGGGMNDPNGDDVCGKYGSVKSAARNHHPTVKPTGLMRYLCRLVTPPGGVVLDPFMGSGSTGKAAKLESFGFVGIEMDADYVEIARARIG